MMYKGISFELSGRFAFFKKPDANINDTYFTYSTIHKVALLGILGAVLGLGGYNQMKAEDSLPEFYRELKNIKISIEVRNKNAYIPKKIQSFTNTTGFASFEEGGTLITKEQWLINPKWNITIITDKKFYEDNNLEIDSTLLNKLQEMLLNYRSVYIPYLGKNDHPAIIDNAHSIEIKEVCYKKDDRIDCLSLVAADDFSTTSSTVDGKKRISKPFKLAEYLPVRLNKDTSLYEFEKLMMTNKILIARKESIMYMDSSERVYSFI